MTRRKGPVREPDTAQLLLDCAEVRERLAALQRALAKKDTADQKVRELSLALKAAKRLAREAAWDVAGLVGQVKRTPVPRLEETKPNGEAV